MSSFLSNWALDPSIWLIFGMVLIIIDMVIGLDFFVLPIGMSALLVSALLKFQSLGFLDVSIIETWEGVAYLFSGLSVVAVGIIKFVFQSRKESADINDY